MIRGLIYAMPCIVFVCLLSFLHFSAMRFASLYRRERKTVVLRVKSKRKRYKTLARTTIKW